MSSSGPRFPAQALSWLTGERTDSRVLALSDAAGLPRRIAAAGNRVWCLGSGPDKVRRLGDVPGVEPLAATTASLPFDACQFDAVLAHQMLHLLTEKPHVSEMARVLRPGGWVAASYLVRDDSVPWVRRLISLMRGIDPEAMSADLGAGSIGTLIDHKYFPRCEQRDFRLWVPVIRPALVGMAARLPAVAALAEDERHRVLLGVGAIYDGASAGSELRLPYHLTCLRAYVDHAEMTTPIQLGEDALIIPL
ncbi:methyltransferase domain-containing protein [uncultured Propionibacterium sp.]|uniref:methyltransferase domain-containing protein n=1 Tax=uncultured Propionibacterium sp. TaxID=218066 RepID=UPI00293002BC|nr:methyltransferase domain-containing protein [uncultured Propionibacterium sp.]